MSNNEPARVPIPWGVWICALVFFALQVGFGPVYPIFRDEFYYLTCADHLAWGYVDHPPFSIFVLAAWRSVFGDSLVSLRILPSLAGAAIVLLVSSLSGALGGGTFARVFAAVSVLAAPTVLGITSFYSMNAFDFVFWLAAFHLLVRLSRTEARSRLRLWSTLGIILGVGLLNKVSVLVLGAGLFAAIVLTPLRSHLRTRGPWIAAALALGLFAPYVIWQIQNGWPTAEFIANASRYKNVSLGPLGFFLAQVRDFGTFNALIWISGLGWLLGSARARLFRGLGFVFVVAFLSFMGGKAYYLAPALLAPLAAGAVAVEIFLARFGTSWLQPAALLLLLASAVPPLPIVVPLLSPTGLGVYMRAIGLVPESAERSELGVLPQHFADRFGWQELTSITAAAWKSLTPEEQGRAIIVTSNYGEAGALNYYGRALGLPKATSQHNNFYLWGPGNPRATIVIAVGISPEGLAEAFDDVQPGQAMTDPIAMPYEREHPVAICRGPKRPLAEEWPRGKHFI
jgi:hypothetical protein